MISVNVWTSAAQQPCREIDGHTCDAAGTGERSIVELYLTSEPEITKNAGPVSDIAEAVSAVFLFNIIVDTLMSRCRLCLCPDG